MRPLLVGLPALALVAAASLGPERSPAASPAAVRGLSALGDASYALYLVHPFVLRGGREVLAKLGFAPWLQPWGSLVVLTLLSVAAALALHRIIERPLTRGLRRRLATRENRVGAASHPVFSAGEDR